MKIVDSHAHLDSKEFEIDIDTVINRAFKSGIEYIVTIGDLSDEISVEKTLKLSEKYGKIYFTLGLHPHQANKFTNEIEKKILKFVKHEKILAIGEIGLDFHYNFSSPKEQIKAFECQIEIAENLKFPIIIHSRNAGEKIYEIIREKNFSQGGILHCFTESEEIARKMIDLNFLISVSGIITFPKAENLRKVIRNLPVDKLLIETDCPYLSPVPYRGKRNEPAFVIETLKKLAEIKEINVEELSEIILNNFIKLFQITY
ncbi:TatD family hydrolase [Candidatus Aminicenantes bacterium AC-335-A11]|jgi:TatD DNase family protein|nr:TatD family hydrolase [SCandidatus Aminicenantes bacterium Aminicenantia_JdfR_composite]MCP2596771.1 TatD family hydrolase [Candidatus Aminicenantes bacterium AC-335-G13]MCP2605557.1 TatD family hydrolase [Candidatus Aminicenantes bacterium AC-335-O07]MCP2617905.1 TatD family hydrolase [Candidatus Aminicenantes bacterium AC-335-A11]